MRPLYAGGLLQIGPAAPGALDGVATRLRRINVLFENCPAVKSGSLELANHTAQVYAAFAEFAEDAHTNRIEVCDACPPNRLEHRGPDVFQMKMPDAGS